MASSGPASIVYNERGRRVEEDEPDMFPEDDMSVVSTRSERIRSPPPLSRPHSSAAGPAPPSEESTPVTEHSIPEVARLPSEFQESRGSRDRERPRGRKSGKGKGKEKETTPEESADSRTSSRLAETLASVWGKEPSPSPSQSREAGAPPAGMGEAEGLKPDTEAAPEAPPASQTPKVEGHASKAATAPRTPEAETSRELEASKTPTASNPPEAPAAEVHASKVATAPRTPEVKNHEN
ncbi:hypothetical protein FB451DRAFT_262461 [Mycena latifolia]|nr:hypothetical protein FB451DRAFT_262461 [Mycena latifolia]